MQTIKTTFLPATNNLGSRIKASTFAGSLTISYDHSLNSEEAHAKAAILFAKKNGWKGDLVSGSDDKHYYFNFFRSSKYSIV